MTVRKYAAPWSTSLVVTSALVTLICVGVAFLIGGDGRLWLTALPMSIVVVCILFSNAKLGGYRAFVTDPHRAVVLEFGTRKVVVSPAGPEGFVHDIRSLSAKA